MTNSKLNSLCAIYQTALSKIKYVSLYNVNLYFLLLPELILNAKGSPINFEINLQLLLYSFIHSEYNVPAFKSQQSYNIFLVQPV